MDGLGKMNSPNFVRLPMIQMPTTGLQENWCLRCMIHSIHAWYIYLLIIYNEHQLHVSKYTIKVIFVFFATGFITIKPRFGEYVLFFQAPQLSRSKYMDPMVMRKIVFFPQTSKKHILRYPVRGWLGCPITSAKYLPGKPTALFFTAIVAGFRGKVAPKRTLGIPGRLHYHSQKAIGSPGSVPPCLGRLVFVS